MLYNHIARVTLLNDTKSSWLRGIHHHHPRGLDRTSLGFEKAGFGATAAFGGIEAHPDLVEASPQLERGAVLSHDVGRFAFLGLLICEVRPVRLLQARLQEACLDGHADVVRESREAANSDALLLVLLDRQGGLGERQGWGFLQLRWQEQAHWKGRRVEWTAGGDDRCQDRDRRRHPRVVQIGALHIGDQPAQIHWLPKPPQNCQYRSTDMWNQVSFTHASTDWTLT